MAELADVVERDEEIERCRVLIVDDHRMFAESLARLLGDEDGIEVVGVAASSEEGVDARRTAEARRGARRLPHARPRRRRDRGDRSRSSTRRCMVVMLTGSEDDRVLLGAIDAGCSGFLTKDRAAGEVARAVRAAASGEALISPAQLARLLPAAQQQAHRGRHRPHAPRARAAHPPGPRVVEQDDRRGPAPEPEHRPQLRAVGPHQARCALEARGGRHGRARGDHRLPLGEPETPPAPIRATRRRPRSPGR